jgi:Uncharacterised protein family (UPF0175)
VQITVNIPDEFAAQISSGGKDPARVALEALALEGYRNESLSEADIRRMLGFASRFEVHAFLKEHGAWLHYSFEDAERDLAASNRARTQSTTPLKR